MTTPSSNDRSQNLDALEGDARVEDAVERKGRRVDPGFRRNIMILGGVLSVAGVLVLIAVLRASGGDAATNPAAVGLSAGAAVQPDSSSKLSPSMQEASLAAERERIEKEAGAGGRVAVPAVGIAADPQPVTAPGAGAQGRAGVPESLVEDPNAPRAPTAAPQAPVSDPYLDQQRLEAERAANQAEAELMRTRVELAKAQLGSGSPLDVAAPQRVSFSRAEAAAAPGGFNAGSAANAGLSGDATTSGPLLTDAMEIYAAELMSPIDSYKGTYVSARVISGRLSGAFVRGQIAPSEDGVTMEFTQMRFAARTCKISAVGMDEKTAHTLVDTNVDRRYMQRYFWPVVVAAVGGAAQARSQTGQQLVPIAGGGVAVSTPPATREQVIAAGTQAAATIVQREVDRSAAKPPQFTLPVGSVVGLMFNEPVAANCR